jgi:hypothetical protein
MENITIELYVNKMLLYKSSLREGVEHTSKTQEYVDFHEANMVIYLLLLLNLQNLFFEN